VAEVIDQCADQPQSIDGLGGATLVNDFGFLTYDGCVWFSGLLFFLLVGWYLLRIYTCSDQQGCLQDSNDQSSASCHQCQLVQR
jgi:hypothetical protein